MDKPIDPARKLGDLGPVPPRWIAQLGVGCVPRKSALLAVVVGVGGKDSPFVKAAKMDLDQAPTLNGGPPGWTRNLSRVEFYAANRGCASHFWSVKREKERGPTGPGAERSPERVDAREVAEILARSRVGLVDPARRMFHDEAKDYDRVFLERVEIAVRHYSLPPNGSRLSCGRA
jgi:hypothetical protein